MPFKLGDVVFLKSGSPPMTVAGLTDDGYVECTFFDDTVRSFNSDYFFEPEMLIHDDRMTVDGDELYLDALVRDQVYGRSS